MDSNNNSRQVLMHVEQVQFLEGVRKAMKGSKLADVAAVCYTDLCKAAGATSRNPSDPSALRLLVADFDSEFKVGAATDQGFFLLY